MRKFTLVVLMLFTTQSYAQGEQLYAGGTATDQEGNSFEWINYGTQDWAIETAEVVTYRDGTAIPQVTSSAEWQNLTTGAWCYFDNDPSKEKLYNWYAVAGIHDNEVTTPNKEFAPEGWYVPTDAEWSTLENHLIATGYNYDGTTTEDKIAKSMAATTGWDERTDEGVPGNNSITNNTSGFNAYPVGFRSNNGVFVNQNNDSPNFDGGYAILWSSTPTNTGAFYRDLDGSDVDLDRASINKGNGATVRFVRGASSVGATGLLLNGTVSAENHQIKNVADPTEAQDAVTKNYTYSKAEVDALIAEAVAGLQSQIDDLESDDGSGTVTDQGGNTYDYLTYGNQAWTVDNAEMVTYRDGTPIPQVTDNTEWENLTTDAWCYINNDPTKEKVFNWYAVMGIYDEASLLDASLRKEFAPEGWHVPSDAEWTTLENYLITNGYNYDGSTLDEKIAKAIASSNDWNTSNTIGAVGYEQNTNNSSEFSAYPNGLREAYGAFNFIGRSSVFWTSTQLNSNNARNRDIYYNRGYIINYSALLNYGFSVRFVRD